MASKKITAADAIKELWCRGDLSYKLKGKQHDIYDAFKDTTDIVNVIASSRRFGKCLGGQTKVLTPTGHVPIKDIKIGDIVYAKVGDNIIETPVIDVFENGEREVYDLVNCNRVFATSTLDHRWQFIEYNKKKPYIKSVKDMVACDRVATEYVKIPGGDVDYPEAYALGAFLGDGCCTGNRPYLTLSSNDEEIVSHISSLLNLNYFKRSESYSWVFKKEDKLRKGKKSEYCTFPYYDDWCRGRYSYNKIVDLEEIKKWNRVSQLKFLAGLLDTDGSVVYYPNKGTIKISFACQSETTVRAFRDIFYRLFLFNPSFSSKKSHYKNGLLYTTEIHNSTICKRALLELSDYIQTDRKKWNPEFEKIRRSLFNPKSTKINPTNPRIEKTYDLAIGTEEHLYLVESGLVTHNSHILCTLATEECIKNPNTIIKYASTSKQQVDEILSIVMRPILEDCPPHLAPEWKEAKKRFEFPNGSQIQIAATEKGHIEHLRGGQCTLGIVDEAGFASNLDYVVQNILIPAVSTTKGRIILCSTPNYEDPQHPFNVDYLAPREAAGTLKKFNIYESPMLDEEAVAATIEAYGGVDNPRFRVEFLCEILTDPDKMVFSELTTETEHDIVRIVDKPAFYDAYVAMDIGFKDLTGVLFAYYDYLQQSIVILDELVVSGPELTTDFLAEQIKAKEKLHFTDKNFMPITPRRIADNNNPILLNDLHRLHGLNFIATAKDNKFAQVNEVKLRLRQNKLIIHPRCENLLYQMRSLKWDKHRKGFMRIRGNKQKGYPSSHGDLPDASVYLVRNVLTTKDPYPPGYFSLQGSNVFGSSGSKQVNKALQSLMNGIMGKKKK